MRLFDTIDEEVIVGIEASVKVSSGSYPERAVPNSRESFVYLQVAPLELRAAKHFFILGVYARAQAELDIYLREAEKKDLSGRAMSCQQR